MIILSVLSAREPKQITLVNQGTIAGMYITRFRTKRIVAYVGIPYAQPPIDFRRFAPPEFNDLPNWEGVRNATIYAPDCMQNDPKREDIQRPLNKHDELFSKLLEAQMEEPRKKEYSEDCLYLNVYVPDGMYFILFFYLDFHTSVYFVSSGRVLCSTNHRYLSISISIIHRSRWSIRLQAVALLTLTKRRLCATGCYREYHKNIKPEVIKFLHVLGNYSYRHKKRLHKKH